VNRVGAGAQSWFAAVPVLFVLLWSTGFIGAKLGLPFAEPFTFLGIRMLMATALLLLFALLTRAPWPGSGVEVGHQAIAGLLVHGIYLGGVFCAIRTGLPAGITALIVGVQPLLTAALVGWVLGEKVTGRQWFGLMLGIAGVALVVSDKLDAGSMTLLGVLAALCALLGITAGTLYQKRFCSGMDLRSGVVIQYAATAVIMCAMAWIFESRQVEWTGRFVFALLWLVLVLSVGAIGLLFTLIRRGAAAKVASLFYLTPPVTAVLAFFLFGETLGPVALLGMGVAMIAVVLVNMPPGRDSAGGTGSDRST
jgi:drug/metabolite transporter (DMT)-like permease